MAPQLCRLQKRENGTILDPDRAGLFIWLWTTRTLSIQRRDTLPVWSYTFDESYSQLNAHEMDGYDNPIRLEAYSEYHSVFF